MEKKSPPESKEVTELRKRITELEAQLSSDNEWPENTSAPVVIDLGKVGKKHIKRLKKGGGKLLPEIAEAVTEVSNHKPVGQKDTTYVPVVLIYRRKDGGRDRLFGW